MFKPIPVFFLALLLVPFASSLSAQSFAELGDDFDDRAFRVFGRYTSVKPGSDARYGGFTVNGSLNINGCDRWDARVRYENPTLGDLLFVVGKMLNGKKVTTASGLEHSFGSGVAGWCQVYTNVVAGDRLLVAPGFSIGDYIFSIKQQVDSVGIVTYDPAGYYFGGGPGLLVTYAFNRGLWIDGYVYYDLCFAKTEYSHAGYLPVEGYPMPHFLTWGMEVNHRSGVFTGVRVCTVNDRGSTGIKASRLDISFGYHFWK